ncbi:MAG TPA: ABC-2 family transporter protein, partial [Myxococcaceae bacterium]|nr:ABC-2 family transporter protein [Myxococcaceae bacterium]
MLRYLKLFWIQLRASILLAVQYRYDFLIEAGVTALYPVTALVPLFVVFADRTQVAGWTLPEMLVLMGWFTLLEGIIAGAISPSLLSVVEHIRKGTLDFVLLKPADAQFLVSTARFQISRVTNAVVALGVFIYAFGKLGRAPSVLNVATSVLLLGSATVLLYSLWILTICAAFYVVKVDNLTYLFSSIYDAARWPVNVFRGLVKFIFTFVIPLALMTTFPSEAMLGRLEGWVLA